MEKISICKLRLPRYIQENVQQVQEKDKLISFFKKLLKGVLQNTEHEFTEDGHIISFEIMSKKNLIDNKPDVNHGELYVYVWRKRETQEIKSYCIMRSKLSNVWQKVSRIRDLRFPFKFAEAFLKEKEMDNIKIDYLTGISESSSILHTSPERFDPDEIIDKYGVVKEFTSSLKNDFLQESVEENHVDIQVGQVKLRVCKNETFQPDDYFSMIKIIDETLSTPGKSWKLLNYIRIVQDASLRKELSENISKEMAEYMKAPKEQYSFEAENTLQHPHESFYRSKKELIYNQTVIREWSGGSSVTIRAVLNALNGEFEAGDYSKEIKKIKLRFFDPILNEERNEYFIDLVQDMQILRSENGKNAYFQHHKCWYELAQETFLETNVRFVNIVQKCLLDEKRKLPKLLPWSCYVAKNAKPPTFTIKELFHFIKVNDDVNESEEESCKNILKILNSEYSLFKCNIESGGTINDVLNSSTNVNSINNFASSNRNVEFPTDHSKKLLDLNCSLLEMSPLAKYFNRKSNENETPSLQKFSNVLATVPDMDTLKSELKKQKEFDNEKLKKLQRDLEKKRFCIVLDEETTNCYKVKCPYITKSVLSKLGSLNVCPIKLLQFLRMNFGQIHEGEYNELYHLFNCKCKVKNSWKYVVGDRIFSNENKNVELFDIMALNMEEQEAYLIHVKKGFGASASRELTSQVFLCGDQIWKSLSVNSKTNMLKMFYNVALSVKSDDNIHKVLTKQEVEDIEDTETTFLDVMKSNKMKYFICFSPCTSKTRKFSFLRQANLDYEFQKNDFKDSDMLEKLQKAGILNGCKITEEIFKSKEKLKKDNDFLKPTVYKKLIGKIGGAEVRNFLSDSSSFVAKMTLIDLYKKFSTFIFNGKKQLKLKILEIPSF